MVVGVIPARRGSKGILKKNLKVINGITLIERAIKFAISTCDYVCVSSDDSEILGMQSFYPNVEFISRPERYATDFSSSESVVTHAIEFLANKNMRFTSTALIQATSPFQDADAFNKSVGILNRTNKINSIFSAIESKPFIWFQNERTWHPSNHSKEHRKMRQELPKTVIETGGFYIFNTDLFLIEKSRFCGISSPAIIKKLFSIDIDNYEDLENAEVLSRILDPELQYLLSS